MSDQFIRFLTDMGEHQVKTMMEDLARLLGEDYRVSYFYPARFEGSVPQFISYDYVVLLRPKATHGILRELHARMMPNFWDIGRMCKDTS